MQIAGVHKRSKAASGLPSGSPWDPMAKVDEYGPGLDPHKRSALSIAAHARHGHRKRALPMIVCGTAPRDVLPLVGRSPLCPRCLHAARCESPWPEWLGLMPHATSLSAQLSAWSITPTTSVRRAAFIITRGIVRRTVRPARWSWSGCDGAIAWPPLPATRSWCCVHD